MNPQTLPKFDWYQGTYHDLEIDLVLASLLRSFEAVDLKPATPRNGYTRSAAIVRGDRELVQLMWEGNPGIHFKSTGDNSPEASEYLRKLGAHRLTRADVCLDYCRAGFFNEISRKLLAFALDRGIKVNQQGDWERGIARTLYLGARSSTVQLVMYEKGYQMNADPNWVRIEVRCYPKGQAGFKASLKEPEQLLGTSWVKYALEACQLGSYEPVSFGSEYRLSDDERARLALAKQYKRVIRSWVDDELGSWHRFADQLHQLIQQVEIDENLIIPALANPNDLLNPTFPIIKTKNGKTSCTQKQSSTLVDR